MKIYSSEGAKKLSEGLNAEILKETKAKALLAPSLL